MNRHGIHYWGAQGLGDDGSGALDDNSRPYQSDYAAFGKTVRPGRYRRPDVDASVDDTIDMLLQTLKDATENKPYLHYRLGCAYVAKGDNEQGVSYLMLAHEQGFSDATTKLVELGVIAPPPPSPPPPPPPKKMGKEELMSFALCIAEEMKHKR